MARTLNSPIDTVSTVETQDVTEIIIDMAEREVRVGIADRNPDSLILSRKYFSVPFIDIQGTARDNFRAVINNVYTFAENNSIIGAGTDSDDMGA